MSFEYLLSFEEYLEAMKTNGSPAKRKRQYIMLIGWAVYMTLMLAFIVFVNAQTPPEPQTALRPQQNLWTTLTPPLVVTGFIVVALINGSFDARRRAKKALATNSAPSQLPASKFAGFIVLLPLALLLLPLLPGIAIYWHPSPGEIETIAFAPWIGLIWILIPLVPFNKRGAILREFAQLRSARRSVRIQATESNLSIENGPNFFRYDWSTFDRYQETTCLIKIYTEDERVLMIPKRVFPDINSLDAFRSLIQNRIPRGTFLPRDVRFPVLPQPVIALDGPDRSK
jgi:hypothetical protein